MSKPINLKQYKDKKTLAKVVNDLESLISIVNLNIKGLQKYAHYKPIANILSVLRDEQLSLETHLKKYRKMLEG